MAQFDPRQFPDMTPVDKAPKLVRYNGCGVTLFGKRDLDAQSQSHVATWCLSFLYVPILALRAYRVARAPRGWYFLGRVPLSKFAKYWNFLLVASIPTTIGLVMLSQYVNSPQYKARMQMTQARHLADQGHLAQAAGIYQTLATSTNPQTAAAAQAVKDLLGEPAQQAPISESVGLFAAAVQVAHLNPALATSDVVSSGMALVSASGNSDPKSGVQILDTLRPLVIDTRPLDKLRLSLLQKWAAAEPANLDAIVPLAALLADQHQTAEAKKLLLPVKDQLGTGEGARVLGEILADEGDLEGGFALLNPYVQSRMVALHAAEKGADDAAKQLWHREVQTLNDNPPADFNDKYNNAGTEEQKDAVLRDYIYPRIKNDPIYTSTQDELQRQSAVVPVALDLGMLMLQRAQSQTDPAQKKAQLKATQDVFLSLQGIADQSDEYRLSLGQVDYWLGDQADGKKLFDQYLVDKGRAFGDLMAIAQRMRLLGSDADARALSEEAYNKAPAAGDRYSSAEFRSACFKNLDDQIQWLNKSDPNDAQVKADLAKANGDKDMLNGRTDDAAKQYQTCIDDYAAMPRSDTTCNNAALAYFGRFEASGDKKDLDRSVDYLQQALNLNPSDSILLQNTGVFTFISALTDITATSIDLHALHTTGSLTMLGYLYHDEATRQPYIQRVSEHPGVTRSFSYLNKLMLLSPKNSAGYSQVYAIRCFTEDVGGLQSLDRTVKSAVPDTSEALPAIQEDLAGTKDQENIAYANAALKRDQGIAADVVPTGGVTAAVALDTEVDDMMSLDRYGQPIDADQTVALASQAFSLDPSTATANELIAAHLLRGLKSLGGQNPDFATYCSKYSRTVQNINLVGFVLGEPGPYQQPLLQNSDIQAMLALVKQQDLDFPNDPDPNHWALFKIADPGEAAAIAGKLQNSALMATEYSIGDQLYPCRADEALNDYWLLQIHNQPGAAKAALQKIADQGIPVPLPQD